MLNNSYPEEEGYQERQKIIIIIVLKLLIKLKKITDKFSLLETTDRWEIILFRDFPYSTMTSQLNSKAFDQTDVSKSNGFLKGNWQFNIYSNKSQNF